MTQSLLAPLVGAHFRPPAKQILQALPAGCPLLLQPEPDNPYDPKAIRVLVQLSDVVPVEHFADLQDALDGTGFDAHELCMSHEPLHLGYIEDSAGKAHAKRRASGFTGVGNQQVLEALANVPHDPDHSPWTGRLEFWADGQPCVRVTVPSDGDPA